jgi:hypothetical protein
LYASAQTYGGHIPGPQTYWNKLTIVPPAYRKFPIFFILVAMIILSVSWIYFWLFMSQRRKLDRIDHVLLWTIKICLLVLFFTLPDLYEVIVSAQLHNGPPQEFFFACSGGDLGKVKTAVKEHPDWVHSRTENGETPLHLT